MMKEYMTICNRLVGSAKLAEGLLIYTQKIIFTFAIGMIFASTTKLFKILIKNIKQHLKFFKGLSNDTTFSQI